MLTEEFFFSLFLFWHSFFAVIVGPERPCLLPRMYRGEICPVKVGKALQKESQGNKEIRGDVRGGGEVSTKGCTTLK